MDLQLALWLIGGLVIALAALVQWWMRRIEADIAAGRRATEDSLHALRLETRADVNGLGERLRAHELKVASDYPSFARLAEIVGPLKASIDRLAEEMREGQERIFSKLDGKQDKP